MIFYRWGIVAQRTFLGRFPTESGTPTEKLVPPTHTCSTYDQAQQLNKVMAWKGPENFFQFHSHTISGEPKNSVGA